MDGNERHASDVPLGRAAQPVPSIAAKRTRPSVRNLLVGLAPIVVSFSAMELAARLIVSPPDPATPVQREHQQMIEVLGLPDLNGTMMPDESLFWKLRPNLDVTVNGHVRGHPISFHVTTNDQGLRSPPSPPKTAALRVLALGDSCTFGVGVDDGATWPAQLQGVLRTLGRDAEVINAAVPGYTAYQGLKFLEARGPALRPDIVLVEFGFNDADDWASRSDAETARALALHRWDRQLMSSRLYTGLKRLALSMRPPAAVPLGQRKPRLSPEEFVGTLAALRDVASRLGASMILVVWPYRNQMDSHQTELLSYQPLIVELGRRAGVPVVNLVPSFVAAGGALFVDHIHASTQGCRLAAEGIAAEIGGGRFDQAQ